MAGSFKLFKDPSLVNFFGSKKLTGNQLRGMGEGGFGTNFDPSVQLRQSGSGFEVLQNGGVIGATSAGNVFDSPGAHGFSLFSSSTPANSNPTNTTTQTATTVAGTNDTDPVFSGGPGDIVTSTAGKGAVVPGDTSLEGTAADPGGTGLTPPPINSGVGNAQLDGFINQTFDPVRFGQIPGSAFQGLFSSGDSVASRLVSGQPVGEMEMANWWQNVFLPSVEQARSSSQNQVSIGGGGTFTLGGSAPGTVPSLTPQVNLPTGADLANQIGPVNPSVNLPTVQSLIDQLGTINLGTSSFGLPSSTDIRDALTLPTLTGNDIGIPGLQQAIAGLDFSAPRNQLTNLTTQANNLALPSSFTTALGDVEETLGGVTTGLDDLGRSQVPGNLLADLQRSQGVLQDLAGGSFGGPGFGFPAAPGLLGQASDQASGLSDILANLTDLPDLTAPLADAQQLNTTFAGLQGQLDPTLQQLQTATGQAGGLQGQLSSLPNLQTLLSRISQAQTDTGQLGSTIGGLGATVDPTLDALSAASGNAASLGHQLSSLPNLQSLLGQITGAQTSADLLGSTIGGLGATVDPTLQALQTASGNTASLGHQLASLPNLQALLGQIGGAQTGSDLLGSTLGGLGTALDPTLTALDTAGTQATGLGGQLASLPDQLQGLFAGIGQAEGGLSGLGATAQGLPSQLNPLFAAMAQAQGGLGGLGATTTALGSSLNPTLDALGRARGDAEVLGRDIGAINAQGLPNIGGAIKDVGRLGDDIGNLPQLPDTSQINTILDAIRTGEFDRLPTDISASLQLPPELTGLPGQLDAGLAGLQPSFNNILQEISKLPSGQGGPQSIDFGPIVAAIEAMGSGSQTAPTGATGTTAAEGTILADIENALRPGIQGGRPQTAEQLRQDPLTASILADLEERNRRQEQVDRERLNRMGVLRGGDNINLSNQRADDQSRQQLAALADAAQRLGGQFDTDVRSGLSLGGQLSSQELAEAGITGNFRGDRTLSGQDQDLANLAAMFPLLQSEFNPITTRDPQQIALVRALLPILPPELQVTLRGLLGG